MENSSKLHLRIEMDLDVETMLKNNISLEKALNWVKLRDDAVVNGFVIRVDAPARCCADERFHLPGGFFALRRRALEGGEDILPDAYRQTYEIIQVGNPFALIKDEEDVVRLAESLIKYTASTDSCAAEDSYWNTAVTKCQFSLLQACCFYLFSECEEADHCLHSVVLLLRSACEDDIQSISVMDILFRDLAARDPENFAVTAYDSFKKEAGPKAAEEAVARCVHRLESMTLDSLYNIMTDMKYPV